MTSPATPDRGKVQALLHRHRHMIWWQCLRHARGNIDRGRDLMQEVVAVLCRCAGQLQSDATSRAERLWVRNITRNVLSKLARRAEPPTVHMANDRDCPDDDVDLQRRELVDELAAHLNDTDRQLLQLYLDGFSNSEIALILGLKEAAVRQRMHRLVAKMRTIYEKLYNTYIQ